MAPLRWGIIGAGRISHDFALSLQNLSSEEHKIRAIGARDMRRSKDFATLFGIEFAFETYEGLARCPHIDIVYIGSVNCKHLELSLLMLKNGKHVLCEKPMTVNVQNTKEAFSFARKEGLFCMEALWSRFLPASEFIRRTIRSGCLGKIEHANATFCVPIHSKERISLKELGGGAMLDIGIYCVNFLSEVMGDEKPHKIVSECTLLPSGVDKSCSAILCYSDDRTASFLANAASACPTQQQNRAIVIGSEGVLEIEGPFWTPTKVILNGEAHHFPIPDFDQKGREFNFMNSAGLAYQAVAIKEALKEGHLEHPLHTHKRSILLAEIIETCLEQANIRH